MTDQDRGGQNMSGQDADGRAVASQDVGAAISGHEQDDNASAQETAPPAIPNVTVAASSNRAGTVTVRATNQGMPVEVKIDRAELRYGGEALAKEIMRLCKLATTEAGARRRELLSEHGMTDDILDRLGLPTRQDVIDQVEADDDEGHTPRSWLRPV